jgi:hypothetical protein
MGERLNTIDAASARWGGQAITHDAIGNLQSDGVSTYARDGEGGSRRFS